MDKDNIDVSENFLLYDDFFDEIDVNTCAFCGMLSPKYELCRDCYNLSKEGIIIKNNNGEWIKNVRKNNEYKFYDENKEYILKQEILNKFEMRFYNIVRQALKLKYTIIPQVNLQSIISTNTNTRNDELYRNVDFALFHSKSFVPFLIIELNGQQHYTNEYYIERDKSVKSILDRVQLPLLTIDIKDIKKMSDYEIYNLMRKVINYLNPNFFTKLFGKVGNKMDLSWVKKEIKN